MRGDTGHVQFDWAITPMINRRVNSVSAENRLNKKRGSLPSIKYTTLGCAPESPAL